MSLVQMLTRRRQQSFVQVQATIQRQAVASEVPTSRCLLQPPLDCRRHPCASSLHAKCVVVDSRKVFVSSANFTEAGQVRNIEVGLKIESEWLAKRVETHFRHLYDQGLAKRAF
ncbi:phospholipase D-like domain-containing protein [Rubinisphaera italica]|uniref:phospholipase D-like domain-containing protein n=1 Tax=Rubinisphaera italica TaxID=2527969 RepID=UPI0011B78406